ncbi:hypothetical protein NM688_g6451 [Phlebia brevispora]|uniref:Uncharacterized protein n=1 Tax=Phlebia brevispora TaxID=194682 RepID=A0ACC1SFZ2_9APHY|nr:hypothetical protein NM688_g6451 [Phlebia brevispora]
MGDLPKDVNTIRSQEVASSDSIDARRTHNAALPICLLPIEIFARILEECLTVRRHSSSNILPPRSSMRQRCQKTLSHVCHYWRDVALSMAILWSYLDIDRYTAFEAVEERLRRSKKALLHLYVDYPDLKLAPTLIDHRSFTAVFRELPRVQTLGLHISDSTLLPWSQLPALYLKGLQLVNYREVLDLQEDAGHRVRADNIVPEDSIGLESLSIPGFARTLESRCPALKSLSVTSFKFSFRDWILPPSLTRLTVYNDASPASPTSFDDVIQTLRRLPSLRHLTLEHALPSGARPATGTNSEPVLPQLQSLTLFDSLRPSVYFMNGLRGSSGSLHLTVQMQTYEELARYPSLSPAVSPEQRLQTISIVFNEGYPRWDDEEAFMFQAWRDQYTLEDLEKIWPASSVGDINISLVVDPEMSLNSDLSSLHQFVAGLPLSYTTSMFLECERNERSSFFPLDAFRCMTKLHTLYVVGNANQFGVAASLVSFLNQDGEVILPSLRVLHLERIDFGARFPQFPRFLKALRKRQGLARIEKLVIRKCHNILPEDVRALEEVIPVDWDSRVRS